MSLYDELNPNSPLSPYEQQRIMRDLQESKRTAIWEGDAERFNQNKDLVLYE